MSITQPSTAAARARELGDLLRSRRERLAPADVGLPAGTRRRTPGLRREEVAMLAAISPTYYAFLEQGRDVRPSRQVLDALARTLRLTAAERAHIRELVHGDSTPEHLDVTEMLAPVVSALVDRLDPCPTYVTGRRFDVLAANRAARALWTDWEALPLEERNLLWWMFTNPAARTILIDWESEAAAQLARFRASAARHPDDPSFRELTDRLQAASPEARAWWPGTRSPRSAPAPNAYATQPSANSNYTTSSSRSPITPTKSSSPSRRLPTTKHGSPSCSPSHPECLSTSRKRMAVPGRA